MDGWVQQHTGLGSREWTGREELEWDYEAYEALRWVIATFTFLFLFRGGWDSTVFADYHTLPDGLQTGLGRALKGVCIGNGNARSLYPPFSFLMLGIPLLWARRRYYRF